MKVEEITSKNGLKIVEVIERNDGRYVLHYYERKYDFEESCEYVIRVHPDPSGLFGDVRSAVAEAKRILDI